MKKKAFCIYFFIRFKELIMKYLCLIKTQILTIETLIKCYLDLRFRCFNAPVDHKAHNTSNG